ncbi:amino acid permease [Candidatus Margulisiibacteriota bacterium]
MSHTTKKKLKKELTYIDVFCICTGAMISSGLFILPGLAYAKAGPAVIVSYLLAALLCIPTMLSKAELTTAMPRAGGDYFYIMRGFGPVLGTIAGFCSWFSLSFKAAFALIGMGAYLSVLTSLPLTTIALICAIIFVVINLIGVKEASRFQIILVTGLLISLLIYILWGIKSIELTNFTPFFAKGTTSVFATASFVFISYGGLTKVAALAEETKDPGRNLPLGMFLSFIVTTLLYLLVIFVTVGVLDPQVLGTSITPISDGAAVFGGNILQVIISIGAFLAFISTANSGIMTASRYPLAMSRDKLLPSFFQNISPSFKTPYVAILFTGLFISCSVMFLKLELLAKIASSVLILLFMFANFALIMFREGNISIYRPKFHAPLYPYMQIIGILGGLFLLVEMGSFILFLTMLFLLLGVAWYKFYVGKKLYYGSALVYALKKFVTKDRRSVAGNLLTELKNVVVENGNAPIDEKPYQAFEEASVLDIRDTISVEDFFLTVANTLETELGQPSDVLYEKLLDNEHTANSAIRESLAVPHIVVEGKDVFKILIIRARAGIYFTKNSPTNIIFVMVNSADQQELHEQVLATITAKFPKILNLIKKKFDYL